MSTRSVGTKARSAIVLARIFNQATNGENRSSFGTAREIRSALATILRIFSRILQGRENLRKHD
jgi:hypothetical protein